MICNKCGSDTPENAAFCPQCGEQLGRAGGGAEAGLRRPRGSSRPVAGRPTCRKKSFGPAPIRQRR